MRIGKQDQPFTAIATSTADAITVRGRTSARDLIGKVGFTDYFYFLVTGKMPTEEQRFFTDAVLVAIAEHGLVPSVQAARMTLAAAPEAWQGAMAAGLLGVGSVVAGSSEVAGKFLVALIAEAKKSGASFEDIGQDGPEAPRRRKAEGAGARPSATFGRRSARDPASEARRRARRGRRSRRHAAASGEAREGDHQAALSRSTSAARSPP